MSQRYADQARASLKAKSDVNRALDQAAGRTLSTDERAEWWIENERFLRMHDPNAYDGLMAEAKAYQAYLKGGSS